MDLNGFGIDLFRHLPFGVTDVPDGGDRVEVLENLDDVVIDDFGNPTQPLVDMDSAVTPHRETRAGFPPVLAGPGRQKGLVDQFTVPRAVNADNPIHAKTL